MKDSFEFIHIQRPTAIAVCTLKLLYRLNDAKLRDSAVVHRIAIAISAYVPNSNILRFSKELCISKIL